MGVEDTIIGTKTYSKVDSCYNQGYVGAVRDSSGKVYYVPKDSLSEFLLYDFTLNYPDTVHCWDGDLIVGYIDSLLILGEYRKLIGFENGGEWLEGIGCRNGLFETTMGNVSGWCYELNCFSQNDTVFYGSATSGGCQLGLNIQNQNPQIELLVYPNPISQFIHIYLPKFNSNHNEVFRVYDQTGNLVKEWPANFTDNTYTLNVTDFAPGNYILSLEGLQGILANEKFVIQ